MSEIPRRARSSPGRPAASGSGARLGAAARLRAIVPDLQPPATLPMRFGFPHAPVQAGTINGGARMRAWYDVYALDGVRREDETGVRASQARVEALIAREKARGVAARRIVLAGFSQGGAIALQTGLRHAERLAGIMALSTYLPLASSVAKEASAANRDVMVYKKSR